AEVKIRKSSRGRVRPPRIESPCRECRQSAGTLRGPPVVAIRSGSRRAGHRSRRLRQGHRDPRARDGGLAGRRFLQHDSGRRADLSSLFLPHLPGIRRASDPVARVRGGALMRLVRFSAAGASPRLGAVLGPWSHWEWVVDLAEADPEIPGDTVAFIDACPGLEGPTWERALGVLAEAGRIGTEAPVWALRPPDVRLHPPIVPRLLRDFLAFRAHVARTRAA